MEDFATWFQLPDFSELFMPTVPLLETFLRGTVVYLALFAMLRGLLKRESSQVGVTDLLVVVLLADAAQNAMADYSSITDGLLLVATIIGWSFTLDWLSYKSPRLNRLIRPGKLLLAVDGKLIRENMRQELITEEELMTELRRYGMESVDEAKIVYIESNGGITAIPRKRYRPTPVKRRRGQ